MINWKVLKIKTIRTMAQAAVGALPGGVTIAYLTDWKALILAVVVYIITVILSGLTCLLSGIADESNWYEPNEDPIMELTSIEDPDDTEELEQ